MTHEEEAKAMKLYRAGKNDREIGKALHFSRENIRLWRKKHGLPPQPRRRKIDDELLKKLYTEGYSDAKIAVEIGCHRQTVTNWRLKNKLPAQYGIGGRLNSSFIEKNGRVYLRKGGA